MSAESRVLLRIVLCVAFITSLYGGMALLTAAMFAKGFMILALVSGLVLTILTATALALFGLAWSMTGSVAEDEGPDLIAQPG